MLEEQLNKLLEWEFVSPDLELEKYFRYNCFSQKWLKISKDKDRVLKYLTAWREETSLTGEDIVKHIIRTLNDSSNPEVYLELLEASKTISDRNLKGLTKKEIAEAERIANAIWKRAVFEESYHEALGE